MRGRILTVASLWIGSPSSLISIVTSAWSVPSLRSTDLTLPTLTPAIRTGEFEAQRVGRLEDGLDAEAVRERDVLGEAEADADRATIASAISPTVSGLRPVRRRRAAAITWSPSVLAGCLPGTLPITLRPARNGSLPASHSLVWPGDAVFGYGFECR